MASSSEQAEEAAVRASILSLSLGDLNLSAPVSSPSPGGEEDAAFNIEESDLDAFQEDELVREALEREVDLRTYSKQIEAELAEAESSVVDDYVGNAPSLAGLHAHIKLCDEILGRMHSQLGAFQVRCASPLPPFLSSLAPLTLPARARNRRTSAPSPRRSRRCRTGPFPCRCS